MAWVSIFDGIGRIHIFIRYPGECPMRSSADGAECSVITWGVAEMERTDTLSLQFES